MQHLHRPRRSSTTFLLIALLLPGFVAGQSSSSQNNPYDLELNTLKQQFDGATPPQAAVLLGRGYELRDYVDDREALTRWLAAAADDSRQHPLVRDEARQRLAQIDVHQGKLEQAEALCKALGFVRQWSIVGPFSALGLDAAAGPERGYQPQASYSDRNGRARGWKTIPSVGPHAWIDLADFYSPATSVIAFAATSLYSEQPRKVALRFSSENAFTLSVNGREVFTRREPGALAFDQHAVAVELRAGWNTVLFKFYRGADEAWRFGLRATEPQGGGVQLRASATQPWTEATAAEAAALPSPDDLVNIAKQAAEATRSAEAWESLARIEQAHGYAVALEHMQRAVALAPNAERWLAIGEMSSRTSERFAALSQALRAEPNFMRARIALADYYAHRGQLEKARDLLKAAVAASPAEFVARKRLADLYATVGLNARAASSYGELERQCPKPLWIKRELARSWEDFGQLDRARELASAALRDDFDGDERGLLERIAERQHDSAALSKSYREILRLYPTDTAAMAKLAALESGSGDFAGAERTLRAALAIGSEDDDLHNRLAEVLATAGRTQAARHEFQQALELSPQNESLRRRLNVGAGTNDPEQPYLINAGELARAAKSEKPRESGGAVVLANVRVQRVFENGLDSVRVQQVTYITTSDGAREHTVQTVQYSPAAEDLRILHARVYKPDGRVVEGEQAGDSAVSDASIAMYYDVRSRAVRFRDLQKGDVVELDYRLTPTATANPYGEYFGELVMFRSDAEQRLQRYVLITPAARKFYIREERMPVAAEVKTEGSQRVYRWEARDLPALAIEPRGPAATEIAPYVHVSTFGSWQELGGWYAQLIRPQFQLDQALREALAQVLEGQNTEADKIRAIHRFVVRNTHYVALEFGVYSYKPYPVSETYARRFGDCKDKASLMIALLRAAGIESDIALVRTRRLGAIGDSPASISVFNHAVVYVPSHDLWLDGTAEYAGPRELPLDDQGAMALTVGLDGQAELRQIPVSRAADNYTRRLVRAEIGTDGVIRFSGTAAIRGEDAPGLRREFEVTERQRDSFRERLAEVFPTVRVEDVSVHGASDFEREVTVDFRGALDTFAAHKTLPLAASWMPRGYVEKLAPLATRSQDLLLPAPWTTDEELRFSLPQGAVVASVPPDHEVETGFGSASLRYEQEQNELIVHTTVQFRKTRIDPEDYPAFRAFCSELERLFRREVKVMLP